MQYNCLTPTENRVRRSLVYQVYAPFAELGTQHREVLYLLDLVSSRSLLLLSMRFITTGFHRYKKETSTSLYLCSCRFG